MGDSSFTRFTAGPAPDTSDILWKANVTGIQTYLSAFDGMVFVGTNTSMVALNQQTGEQIWKTDIAMPKTWPIAYKIDDDHLVVENSCLTLTQANCCGQAHNSALTPASLAPTFTALKKKCSTLKSIPTLKVGVSLTRRSHQLWFGEPMFQAAAEQA